MSRTEKTKEIIREYYKQMGKLPTRKTNKFLYHRMMHYCAPSCSCYDPEFHEWVKSCGYRQMNPSTSVSELVDFHKTYGRLPSGNTNNPKERRLYIRLRNLCTVKGMCYNPAVRSWAVSLGYGRRRRARYELDSQIEEAGFYS